MPSNRWLLILIAIVVAQGLYILSLQSNSAGDAKVGVVSTHGDDHGHGDAHSGHDDHPSRLEPIHGTDVSRVILSKKARERLDVQTVEVLQQVVKGWRMIAGQVQSMDSGAAGPKPATPSAGPQEPDEGQAQSAKAADNGNGLRVQATHVGLSQLEKTNAGILVLPLIIKNGDENGTGYRARLASDSEKRTGQDDTLTFVVEGNGDGLKPGDKVRVRVQLPESGLSRKVIPQSAVIYDAHGKTWTYTNPEPLVYMRAPITIDYISNGKAFLVDGPDAGTKVVNVAAPELFGAEFEVGH